MSTLVLLLTWSLLGLLIAGLALLARLQPASWKRSGWWWMLLLGIGSSLLGGILGSLLLGRLFSTATALWISVLAVGAPWLLSKLRLRLITRQKSRTGAYPAQEEA